MFVTFSFIELVSLLSIAAAPPAIAERSGKNQPTAPSRDRVKAARYSAVWSGVNAAKAASTHTPCRKTGLPITLNRFKGRFVIFETLTS